MTNEKIVGKWDAVHPLSEIGHFRVGERKSAIGGIAILRGQGLIRGYFCSDCIFEECLENDDPKGVIANAMKAVETAWEVLPWGMQKAIEGS